MSRRVVREVEHVNPPSNRLPLPPLLVRLIAEARWRQPEDAQLSELVPFVRDPLDFLLSEESLRRESRGSLADHPDTSKLFRLYRGNSSEERPLPWLDADLSVFIAINRYAGDDVAIALDYRTSFDDPRVVASEWAANNSGNYWREAFPSFSAFVAALYPTA